MTGELQPAYRELYTDSIALYGRQDYQIHLRSIGSDLCVLKEFGLI